MALPQQVNIVEVGPRDGLQNETTSISVQTKLDLIHGLAQTGLNIIEAGSFVSPKWVPQMADSDAVFRTLSAQTNIRYPALVPNLKGLELALEAGVQEIACFTAASDAFNIKNTNCSVDESLKRIALLVVEAQKHKVPVRGYVSCVVGCPYQGDVQPRVVLDVTKRLLDMGCYEVSLGDTIGVGTPAHFTALLEYLLPHIPATHLALHCHDTYGQALANIYAGLQMGINKIDSSVAGLGGCPYAPGASGNVATEDVVYMLQGLGIESGVDLTSLVKVGDRISRALQRDNASKVATAMLSAMQPGTNPKRVS